MMSNIRHIIFDLGGVLLDIDYQNTEQAFKQLGCNDFDAHYNQLKQNAFFDRWETGRLEEEEFISQLQERCATGTTAREVVDAWNAMLLSFPLRRLQILDQLRYQFDIYLLSNTNSIHERAFHEILLADHGYRHIGLFFDRFYFSHRLGMRKPDVETFEHVLSENHLKPEHTLFIDDSPQHIKGASQLGIQTIYLEPGITIENNIFKPKSVL